MGTSYRPDNPFRRYSPDNPFAKQEAEAESEQGVSGLPDAAPVDRLDQTIRNPQGKDPMVRYGLPIASAAIGAGMGGALASRVLGAAPSILRQIGSGIASGVTGGAAGRAAAQEGGIRERAKAAAGIGHTTMGMPSMAFDAATGGVIPPLAAGAGVAARYLGLSRKAATARGVQKTLDALAEAKEKSHPDIVREIGGSVGGGPGMRPIAVTDLDDYHRSLGLAVAKRPAGQKVLQDLVEQRKDLPVQGALTDIEALTGKRPVDVAVRLKAMKEANSAADEMRFAPIFQKYSSYIEDPNILKEFGRARRAVPNAWNAVLEPRRVAGESTKDLYRIVKIKDAAGNEVRVMQPTLKGLHFFKSEVGTMAGQAGKKIQSAAEVAGSKKATVKSLRTINNRLSKLAETVGGDEYADAVRQSRQGFEAVRATASGANALRPVVSPTAMTAEMGESVGRAVDPADVATKYGEGFVGRLAQRVKAAQSKTTAGIPSNAPLNILSRPDIRAKLASVSDDPIRIRPEIDQALDDYAAIQETNRLHLGGETRPSLKAASEKLGAGLGGAFGEAAVLGDIATGQRPSVGTFLGALTSKVLQGRRAPAYNEAARLIASLEAMPVGPGAQAEYLRLLQLLNESNRRRGIISSAVSGGISGAIGGRREP